VLRGFQTFLQLARVTPKGFSVPVVTHVDKPRFPWRGGLIDSGHRFLPISVLKRNLDGMEAVKHSNSFQVAVRFVRQSPSISGKVPAR
jgi:hexosaminidase